MKLKHPFNKKTKMAGNHWLYNFLKRHPSISLRRPEGTSLARMSGFTRVEVNRFFDNLREVKSDEYALENIYNVDETGLSTVPRLPRVLAAKGQRAVSLATSAEKGQTTTAICCMSAAGTCIPPALVFARKRIDPRLKRGAPPGTTFFASDSGWSNGSIFSQWLTDFASRSGAGPDKPVLLLLDNHESHVMLETYNIAERHNITMVSLPPHTSHKLQPMGGGRGGAGGAVAPPSKNLGVQTYLFAPPKISKGPCTVVVREIDYFP